MQPTSERPYDKRVMRLLSTDTNGTVPSSRTFSNPILSFNRWISGAGDPRCALHLVLGKSDPNNSDRYRQQSIVIVPANTPGVTVVRPMKVFGYDDAPEGHNEIIYDNVRVPLSNLVLGWGKGFEVQVAIHGIYLMFVNSSFRLFKVDSGEFAGRFVHQRFLRFPLLDLGESTIACALLVLRKWL